ncbi:MAG: single-stranded DNA-binding protein [Oscillospiraceae bacterium]|jgi:hypothetical protein|nr:single-stranded DNA-binding protein [Oscillospiraceae bacterium]
MHITETINFEDRQSIAQLMGIAKKEIMHLHEGETFFLADLFRGYKWKRIPANGRKMLGRYFLDFAEDAEGKKFVALLDIKARRQTYVRK